MREELFADIIIDISHENLDKTYQYAISPEHGEEAVIGASVKVPFGKGNRVIGGYIIGLSTEAKIDRKFIKYIHSVDQAPVIENHLIYLAHWMKETFGGTMNESLKTVIPVKKAVKIKEQKTLVLNVDKEEATELYYEYQRKNNRARVRLLDALIKHKSLDMDVVTKQLNITKSVLDALEKKGITKTISEQIYRNPIVEKQGKVSPVTLNEEQAAIVEDMVKEYGQGIRRTYLVHGITGSGKTEVYMEMISSVIAQGKEVIVLIPEIALTYQTVQRFYRRFGDRVSIMNSKMSQGERFDQSERAKRGEIDIIIGPRSALFTPFRNLGLIIIDEEHETSYKSEVTPKYHTTAVAIERARLTGSSVVLGSATPLVDSYYQAQIGNYKLYHLTKRAKTALNPSVWIVDLREELKKKNKSIFSIKLRELIVDRLNKKEQIMIFINRRGYAGFVSCRSCGYVVKCPHCDISLTFHNSGQLICHYCGYEEAMPKICPSCSSKYIASFGTGTQKVEEFIRKEFPQARVLRMDMDTTKQKGGHEKILKAFHQQEADILVGTQMIVKGHDFPKVTLVGIVAADLSLYAGDFRAGERTFQLLCQAAGRAGRDSLPGEVVIQTYNPEHYSVITSATGDYEKFYQQEMSYRRMMLYPPVAHILLILLTSKDENKVLEAAKYLATAIDMMRKGEEEETAESSLESKAWESSLQIIGPAPATIAKINDIHRQVMYLKSPSYDQLVGIKNYLEGFYQFSEIFSGCNLQFDFNPMNGY